MKYLIASDIHGSSYYCEKLVEAFNYEKADLLVILGDILYHGPRNDLPAEYSPKKVISLLTPLADKIIAVRGNCDAEVDQMVLNFSILSESSYISDSGRVYAITHGHHLDEFIKNSNGKCDAIFFGHTHVPECTEKSGTLTVNPGSVSIPKENSCHSYIVLEKGTIEWKDIENNSVYKTHTLK